VESCATDRADRDRARDPFIHRGHRCDRKGVVDLVMVPPHCRRCTAEVAGVAHHESPSTWGAGSRARSRASLDLPQASKLHVFHGDAGGTLGFVVVAAESVVPGPIGDVPLGNMVPPCASLMMAQFLRRPRCPAGRSHALGKQRNIATTVKYPVVITFVLRPHPCSFPRRHMTLPFQLPS